MALITIPRHLTVDKGRASSLGNVHAGPLAEALTFVTGCSGWVYAKGWIEENWALYGNVELQRSLLSLSKLY